jgi:hypothetical protein
MNTDDSNDLEEKRARNEAERHRQIRQWAEYVRTHPDEDWGRQVNKLVNSQLESARHHRNRGKRTSDGTAEGNE